MRQRLFLNVLLFLLCIGVNAQVITPEIEKKAEELLKQMTLEEKIDYISGDKGFYIRAIPRLGIPEVRMADGPQGIRNDTKSTLFPAGILSASTWNRSLINQLGIALGQDAKSRGVNILLGPGVNIYRAPMCSRNFEYFGEDPYLAGEIAKEYILGVQSQKVIATVKHLAGNNQEWERHDVSTDIDDRTLHEIYLPAFEKAVKKANVGAIMNSYNPLNSVHASENKELNIDILRKGWKFKGILMSDWNSVYSTMGAVNGGIDLEMPSGIYMNRKSILPAIANGILSEKEIDTKVRHILQTIISFGFLDNANKDESIPADNPFSREVALNLAREGVVLLKNTNNTLPLSGKVLLLGHNADRTPSGGGSGFVQPFSSVSVYEGLKKELKKGQLQFLQDSLLFITKADDFFIDKDSRESGFTAEYFSNRYFLGTPHIMKEKSLSHDWGVKAPIDNFPENGFSVRWTATYAPKMSGIVQLSILSNNIFRLFVNDNIMIDHSSNYGVVPKEVIMDVKEGDKYQIKVEYCDRLDDASIKFKAEYINENLLAEKLKDVDHAILSVGFDSDRETEGSDRPFELPKGHEELIRLVAKYNKKTTVVLNGGGSVDFSSWINDADAILMAWYPGQEGGTALAEILTGKISPSGKLPISIEKRWEDNPSYNSYYDTRNIPHKRVQYNEGVFIGYRGYDKNGVEPLFPFGYGLSYTSFVYSNINVSKISDSDVTVSFTVKNTGKKDASEVAQIYVTDMESSVPRPEKELKGFEKIHLKKGEEKQVTITLDKRAFSFYSLDQKQFVMEKGEFKILVGSSSKDLPLKATVSM